MRATFSTRKSRISADRTSQLLGGEPTQVLRAADAVEQSLQRLIHVRASS